jgi:Flp pilus assembly protein TadG
MRVQGDRGAAAVEAALILPVLLLLVCGVVDLGRALHAQLTVTAAAREGARAAVLNANPTGRANATAASLDGGVTVSVTPCPASPGPYDDATVTVTTPYQPVTPLGSLITMFGGTESAGVTITGTGVMPCLG